MKLKENLFAVGKGRMGFILLLGMVLGTTAVHAGDGAGYSRGSSCSW